MASCSWGLSTFNEIIKLITKGIDSRDRNLEAIFTSPQ